MQMSIWRKAGIDPDKLRAELVRILVSHLIREAIREAAALRPVTQIKIYGGGTNETCR